jgi:hypothetical protein
MAKYKELNRFVNFICKQELAGSGKEIIRFSPYHAYSNYINRCLIQDEHSEKIKKEFGQQYWLEAIMLTDMIFSSMVPASYETYVLGSYVQGFSDYRRSINKAKSWLYFNYHTGNVFLCAREYPFLTAITCFRCEKMEVLKPDMSMGKWFYKIRNFMTRTEYFNRIKTVIKDYNINKPYELHGIGYLDNE